jgi:uncharacterized protein
MRLCALILSLICLGGCLHGHAPVASAQDSGAALEADALATADAEEVEEGVLTVATFNVRRYFDMICHSGQCDDPDDFEIQMSPEAFEARTQQLAAAIVELKADIVLLQEVENAYCLGVLGGRLEDLFAQRVIGETNFPASLDVGVLARGILLEKRTHRSSTALQLPNGTTTKFSRELLELHLEIDGAYVVVFNAHFKSKSGDEPERRIAEAKATRAIVLATVAEHPEALVVLGGDLNDTPSSEALIALEGDGGLVRLGASLPVGQDWTYLWGGGSQALDHLYLATGASGAMVEGGVSIERDETGTWGGSDHAAVRAQLRLP